MILPRGISHLAVLILDGGPGFSDVIVAVLGDMWAGANEPLTKKKKKV